MATIKCTIDKSSWYEVYIEYGVSQDPVTAKSTITHALKLKQLTNTYDFSGAMNVTYKIGGDSFSYSGNIDIVNKGNTGYTITIKSGTTVIQHDTSTGAGSFYVECSGRCNSGGWGPGNISLSGRTISLTTIDRVAPTISLSASNITASSVIITATSDKIADIWDYSIDNGSTWVRMSTTASSSTSKAIAGLSPNTLYSIKARARRQYNRVYGSSSTQSIKTLGNSILNSVNTLTVDVENPVLTMNWTVYAAYTHTLVIKDGSTTVLTITDLTCSTGTNNKTVTLTAAQRTTILQYMESKKSFTATFCLTTYSGTNQIGSTVSKTATIQTTSGTSAPSFSGFTHKDSDKNGTFNITGNEQIYIKGYSSLQIVIGERSAKNEASISSYKVTVGSDSKSFTTTTIDYGTISLSGNVTLKVEVIDSRGYSTAITNTLTVIDYKDISITDYTIRRKNEVEATVQLAFSGDIAPITIDGEAQNRVESAKFRYAPNGGEWSGWSNLTVAETNRNFEYETLALSNSSGVLEFNPSSQYTLDIKITDRLSSDTVTIILNKGTPLMSFRSRKVGINTPDPQAALDVVGDTIIRGNLSVGGHTLLDYIYPVGSIYLSVLDTSPQVLFGGTWERVKDSFLLASGDKYEAGATGGEPEHTLTTSELPDMGKFLSLNWSNQNSKNTGIFGSEGMLTQDRTALSGTDFGEHWTTLKGGEQPHNNMPPYLAVYIWKRIS